MNKIIIIILLTLVFVNDNNAQFAPPPGEAGSTAIHKDSNVFVNWAEKAEIQRGYVNISDKSLGYVDYGETDYALGIADGKVVSLGDSGVVVIYLDAPVVNGDSWDFAVFENGFNDEFLELAFVEVSSDGVNYFRFPAVSLTDTLEQVGTFGTLDTRKLHNFAGKYRVNYGTPFDLDSLDDNQLLDKNNIRFIKIIDVIGSIDPQYATYDSKGDKVNDPFPTPFNTGGFDLDAVGIIHQKSIDKINNTESNELVIFPNPVNDKLHLTTEPNAIDKIEILDINGNKKKSFIFSHCGLGSPLGVRGKTLKKRKNEIPPYGKSLFYDQDKSVFDVSFLYPGIYLIKIKLKDGKTVVRKFVKE